jgi:hypothetical protein
MDQELIGLNLPVTRRLVQALQHQAGHHGSGHRPADQAPAIKIIAAAQRTSRCDIARYLQHPVVLMVVILPASNGWELQERTPCCSRFSSTALARLPVFWQGLKTRWFLAWSAALRV